MTLQHLLIQALNQATGVGQTELEEYFEDFRLNTNGVDWNRSAESVAPEDKVRYLAEFATFVAEN